MHLGQQVDFLAYRYGFPVGVARLSVQGETAHVLALALLKEVRTPAMVRALQTAVVQGALQRQASLIFAPGETDADRRICRELGFVDFGSIVSYAAPNEQASEVPHDPVEQPILSF
jgi:hypothetical protein